MTPMVADVNRRLIRRVVELERRLACVVLTGTVAEIDHAKRRLRLAVGTNASGNPVLSPWVRWAEAGGDGLLKVHVPPKKGVLMTLISPSGTIGEGSVAHWATYTDGNQAPSQADDTAVLQAGSVEVHLKESGALLLKASQSITLDVGGDAITITPEEIRAGKVLRAKGGSRPAHYVGGADSAGDRAVDGNENLLV